METLREVVATTAAHYLGTRPRGPRSAASATGAFPALAAFVTAVAVAAQRASAVASIAQGASVKANGFGGWASLVEVGQCQRKSCSLSELRQQRGLISFSACGVRTHHRQRGYEPRRRKLPAIRSCLQPIIKMKCFALRGQRRHESAQESAATPRPTDSGLGLVTGQQGRLDTTRAV